MHIWLLERKRGCIPAQAPEHGRAMSNPLSLPAIVVKFELCRSLVRVYICCSSACSWAALPRPVRPRRLPRRSRTRQRRTRRSPLRCRQRGSRRGTRRATPPWPKMEMQPDRTARPRTSRAKVSHAPKDTVTRGSSASPITASPDRRDPSSPRARSRAPESLPCARLGRRVSPLPTDPARCAGHSDRRTRQFFHPATTIRNRRAVGAREGRSAHQDRITPRRLAASAACWLPAW